MSFTSFLIATGAAALGYRVIRSVLEPGVNLREVAFKSQSRKPGVPPVRDKKARGTAVLPHAYDATVQRQADYAWYVVLDVSQSAGRLEIQEALKRRIAKARADGDHTALAELLRAAAAGIREPEQDTATGPRPRSA